MDPILRFAGALLLAGVLLCLAAVMAPRPFIAGWIGVGLIVAGVAVLEARMRWARWRAAVRRRRHRRRRRGYLV